MKTTRNSTTPSVTPAIVFIFGTLALAVLMVYGVTIG